MFENCSAYVIVNDSEWQTRLSHIMRQIGFNAIYKLVNTQALATRHPTHLPFLFIHSKSDRTFFEDVVGEIRNDGDDDVRFMPIIMLSSDHTEQEIGRHLALGCDDIIIYPSPVRRVVARLRQQIHLPQEYFQTATYFGPDRRKGQNAKDHPDRRGGVDSYYRRITIRRDIRGGIKILSNETHQPQERAKSA